MRRSAVIGMIVACILAGCGTARAVEKGEIGGLIAELKSGDAARQIKAAEKLTAFGPDGVEAAPELLNVLATEYIANHGGRLGTITPSVAASHALDALGPAALPALQAALADPRETLRINVLFQLFNMDHAYGTIGEGNRNSGLVREVLAKDKTTIVRSAAVLYVSYYRDRESFKALVAAMGDADRLIQGEAMRDFYGFQSERNRIANLALREDDALVIAAARLQLHNEDVMVRGYAAELLASLEDRGSIDELIKMLSDKDAWARAAAAKALRAFVPGNPDEARYVVEFEKLLAMLQAKDAAERIAATNTLAKLGDARAVKPMLRLLDDGDPKVVANTPAALGKMGDRRAYEPLAALLTKEDRALTPVVIPALGNLRDPRALELLQGISKKNDPYLNLALTAMGDIGGPEAVDFLIECLYGANNRASRWAGQVLAKTRDPQVMPRLVAKVAADKPGRINAEASATLEKLTGQRFVYPTDVRTWWDSHKALYGEDN